MSLWNLTVIQRDERKRAATKHMDFNVGGNFFYDKIVGAGITIIRARLRLLRRRCRTL